ncbi:MAG: cell division protein SepF [Ruminococcus sp.]|jgi:cell division inhibitor SepF|nr:cell division protein SepF [Ruminococcus sp.]
MGIVSGFKNFFIGEDEEPEIYQAHPENNEVQEDREMFRDSNSVEYNQAPVQTPTYDRKPAAVMQLVLARPKTFQEVKSIGDEINAQKTVILNLETVSNDVGTRIVDFLSGVSYANRGTMKLIAAKTFAILPEVVAYGGADIAQELEKNGYNF